MNADTERKTESQPIGDELWRGVSRQNPIFVQALGMCPVLAVSNTATNALAMGLATAFVLLMSNMAISSIRNFVPRQVRIVTYILVIATCVTVVDYLIQAISLELHKGLGAFISLIVVNCLILGRAESFASRHGLRESIVDALGMGLGFCLALLGVGVVRELMGYGSLFGVRIFGEQFQTWVVMVLPAGGFFVLAAWLLLLNWIGEIRFRLAATGENGDG